MSKRQARIGGKLRRGVLVVGVRLGGRNAYVRVSSVVAGILGEGRKQEGTDEKLKECVYVQSVDMIYVFYVAKGERGNIHSGVL